MAWDREKERKAAKSMGIASSVFAVIFGIIWCLLALSMGAGFMLIFGIPFVGFALYRLGVMLKLSGEDTSGTTPKKETDPWDRPQTSAAGPAGGDFCPYCGFQLQSGFEFCPKCGRRLP